MKPPAPTLDLTSGYDYSTVLVKHGGSPMPLWELGLAFEEAAMTAAKATGENLRVRRQFKEEVDDPYITLTEKRSRQAMCDRILGIGWDQ